MCPIAGRGHAIGACPVGLSCTGGEPGLDWPSLALAANLACPQEARVLTGEAALGRRGHCQTARAQGSL